MKRVFSEVKQKTFKEFQTHVSEISIDTTIKSLVNSNRGTLRTMPTERNGIK